MSETTTQPAAIYAAIIGVMDDVGAVAKDRKNTQQGFMYRGVDDVMNAIQPAMVKHGVFVVPEVLSQERQERQTRSGGNMTLTLLRVRYSFYAKDGSSVSAEVVGEAMDNADKSSNKAMSVAYKYACFQVFSIPTEEQDDPDAESVTDTTPIRAQEPRRAANPAAAQRKAQTEKSKAAAAPSAQEQAAAADAGMLCMQCGRPIGDHGRFKAAEIARNARNSFGVPLCWDCATGELKKQKEEAAANAGS